MNALGSSPSRYLLVWEQEVHYAWQVQSHSRESGTAHEGKQSENLKTLNNLNYDPCLVKGMRLLYLF